MTPTSVATKVLRTANNLTICDGEMLPAASKGLGRRRVTSRAMLTEFGVVAMPVGLAGPRA